MGRYMTIARILLFLSIVRFGFAAPVAVREVHEVHVNVVDVAKDGTATSQKRTEPWDDCLTNAVDKTAVLMTPAPRHLQDSPDLNYSPWSSTEFNSVLPSPALSARSRPRSPGPGSTDDSHPPYYWSPPSVSSTGDSPPSPRPGSTDDSPPSPRPGSTDDSHPPYYWSPPSVSSTGDSPPSPRPGSTDDSPPSPRPGSTDDSHPPYYWSPPPASLTGDSPPLTPQHLWVPPSTLFTDSPPPFYWSPPSASSSEDALSTSSHGSPTEHSPPPSPPPSLPPPPHPDNSLPSSSPTLLHHSTDDHPQSSSEPPRPTDPLAKDFPDQSGSSNPAESEVTDFLSQVSKGKFKRRISDSGAVNL